MNGLQCPMCAHSRSSVVDSRPDKHSVKRRRKCDNCGHRWSTWEVAVGPSRLARIFQETQQALSTAARASQEAIERLRGM